ncbi:cyclin-dependent kinase 14-like [Centruroides sculpturatus]|uniref:cyclin-dependent kinase 14-like n=1 Tax=Centruroides sculpturatus TaxID=218467 RepID=UPI000C6CD9B0|nr:cyclin-dependent kinase 14-like [Centruroides sculpturatus]
MSQGYYVKSTDGNMKDKKNTISRIQRLKRHLSCGFGRLSVSKEDIVPEFDQDNENIEVTKVTLNGLDEDRTEILCPSTATTLCTPLSDTVDNYKTLYEPNGNIRPPPRTSSTHSHLDNYSKRHGKHAVSPVKRQWSAQEWVIPREELAKITEREFRLHIPRRPKSEVICGGERMKSSRYSGIPFSGNLTFGKTEAYIKLEQLGEGSYATVYKGYSKMKGVFKSNLIYQLIYCTRINLLNAANFSVINSFHYRCNLISKMGFAATHFHSASLLRGLKHANIITLHDIIHTRETLTFVFEFVHTDLGQYLGQHPGGLHPKNIKLFLFQLLRGLAYCHDRHVLHRDLKPQNLLISELGELKLADFGLARAKSVPSRTYSHEVVTLWYRPPDVLLGSTDYSTSLDMWGVGCIFIEMIYGSAAFPGLKDAVDQLDKIWKVLGTPTEETWEGVSRFPNYKPEKFKIYKPQHLSAAFPKLIKMANAEKLASSFLQLQPHLRISATQALHHKYFSDLPSKVYDLPDQASVFNVPSCKLSPETHNHPLSVIEAAAKLQR